MERTYTWKKMAIAIVITNALTMGAFSTLTQASSPQHDLGEDFLKKASALVKSTLDLSTDPAYIQQTNLTLKLIDDARRSNNIAGQYINTPQ